MSENSVFQRDDDIYNKTVVPIPAEEKSVGVETNNELFSNIIEAGEANTLNVSSIESFSNISDQRDQEYKMLDSMYMDPTMSSAIDLCVEDATERNDEGRIVWATADDKNVSKYVTYLLDTMNIDKMASSHISSLIKYGDLYLRLYRQSEYKDDLFDNQKMKIKEETDAKTSLQESVKIKAFSEGDKYAHYIERVDDPSTMFELTRFGKTSGYICAPHMTTSNINAGLINNFVQYSFNDKDIEVYDATEFVHATVNADAGRTREKVNISTDDKTGAYSYSVRRGKPVFYDTYRIWRQLSLLENSILLNRITKSSVTRIIGVEVKDMPKDQVKIQIAKVKNLIEQKSSLKVGEGMTDYNSAGPVVNNVYIPTNDGKGALSVQTLGEDVDVKSLADLDYFKNKFYGSIKIPKQFMGDMDDAAGFSGGESLAIVSSRYAKTIKKIQDAYTECLTNAINLMLLDKNLPGYIGKFTLHMMTPATKEEKDRRDSLINRVALIRDVQDVLNITDDATRLKVCKAMLGGVVSDEDVMTTIDEYIKSLEAENVEEEDTDTSEEEKRPSLEMSKEPEEAGEEPSVDINSAIGDEIGGIDTEEDTEEEVVLPSPEDIGIDMTDNSAEEI